MSYVFRRPGYVLLTIALLAFCVPVTKAAYVISIQPVGPDVVTTGSGSIDTTDLTFFSTSSDPAVVGATNGVAYVGSTTGSPESDFTGLSGPTTFGSGDYVFASSGSGPSVGVFAYFNGLLVPSPYTSGSLLSLSTDTYSNQTLSTLGLTPGTYDYTWGTGQHADSLTVNIIPAATGVPLPAGLYAALLAIPFAFIARKRLLAV